MKKLFPIVLLLSGCAFHSSKLYDPATGNLVATTRIYTLFDSQSSLAKLHIDTLSASNKAGIWSPGISLSGMQQEASSTNLNEILAVVVGAAVKAAK
jgi:hypothetical protein